MKSARWGYWDILALAAGVTPPGLAVAASALDIHYGGAAIFLGSAGQLFWALSLACAFLFLPTAYLGWQSGSRGLIALGGLLLVLSAAPSLVLLAACASGSCL